MAIDSSASWTSRDLSPITRGQEIAHRSAAAATLETTWLSRGGAAEDAGGDGLQVASANQEAAQANVERQEQDRGDQNWGPDRGRLPGARQSMSKRGGGIGQFGPAGQFARLGERGAVAARQGVFGGIGDD